MPISSPSRDFDGQDGGVEALRRHRALLSRLIAITDCLSKTHESGLGLAMTASKLRAMERHTARLADDVMAESLEQRAAARTAAKAAKGVVAALLLLLAMPASAQTGKSESCETVSPNQTAATIKADEKRAIGFCGEAPPYAEPVLRDGGKPDDRPEARFIRDEAPASNGTFYFATKLLDFTVGTHNLTVDYLKLEPNGAVLTAMAPPLVLTVEQVITPPDPCLTAKPSVFVTGFTKTTGNPGSMMLVNYQLASSTPVVQISVKVDGQVVRATPVGTGVDLVAFGSMWFIAPASGQHAAAVVAVNAAGCSTEALSPLPLRIK